MSLKKTIAFVCFFVGCCFFRRDVVGVGAFGLLVFLLLLLLDRGESVH